MKAAVLLVLLSASVVGAHPQEIRYPPNRQSLLMARFLVAPTMEERLIILNILKRFPMDHRETVILDGLLTEAQRMMQLEIDGDIAQRGKPIPVEALDRHADEDYSAYKFEVIKLLAEYQDPRIIPVMLHFAQNAVIAADAVADFGEDALPHVIMVAVSDDDEASTALDVLAQMLVRRTMRKPLSPQSSGRIVGIAGDRLRGQAQNIGVAYAAIRLAKATGDPELLKRLKRLAADDRRGAQEIGVHDPEQLEMLREVLREEVTDAAAVP